LEEGAGKAFLTGEDAAGFAASICLLLGDFDHYCSVSRQAYAFAGQYNQGAYAELTGELERLRQ
jgi:hypothetical protein